MMTLWIFISENLNIVDKEDFWEEVVADQVGPVLHPCPSPLRRPYSLFLANR